MKKLSLIIVFIGAYTSSYAQKNETIIQGRPAYVWNNTITCGSISSDPCFIIHSAYTSPKEVLVETFKENSIELYKSNTNFKIVEKENTPNVATFQYLEPIRN